MMPDKRRTRNALFAGQVAALPASPQRYPMGSIGVFGCWAQEQQTATSDADLVGELAHPLERLRAALDRRDEAEEGGWHRWSGG